MAAYIVGAALSPIGRKLHRPALSLMNEAVVGALADASARSPAPLPKIGALITFPSLSQPLVMPGHRVAETLGDSIERSALCRAVDCGGASPVVALRQAVALVRGGEADLACVVGADAVGSLSQGELLRRVAAGAGEDPSADGAALLRVPGLYDRYARLHAERHGTTRSQLAAVAAYARLMASRHPAAVATGDATVDAVLATPPVAEATTVAECAVRCDGGGALIVASEALAATFAGRIPVLGTGEASMAPDDPPATLDEVVDSVRRAAYAARAEAGVERRWRTADIVGWAGVYDCFPVSFLAALEGTGLVDDGRAAAAYAAARLGSGGGRGGPAPPALPAINTHGGLLGFGAPWEAPALFSAVEAVAQLRGEAGPRQVPWDAVDWPTPARALVHANGGIFFHQAVAFLGAAEG